MSSNWKVASLGLAAVVFGVLLAVFLLPLLDDHAVNRDGPLTTPSESSVGAVPVDGRLPERDEQDSPRTNPGSADSVGQRSDSVKNVLELALACLSPGLEDSSYDASKLGAISECLRGLDWSRVAAPELASWLCSERPPLRQGCLVLAAALYARTPSDAVAYLADYEPECREVAETGLQIMAVEQLSFLDPLWVEELAHSMTPEALFTGDSSEQGLLLAEFFIRRGDSTIRTLLEKGGRGEYGGSEGEITRAARVCLFVTSTIQGDPESAYNAWSYADSLLSSQAAPPATGGVLAPFLANRQTWPNGDSTLALQTLLQALDDPGFRQSATTVLYFMYTPDGPDGCDKGLWSEIYAQVLADAEKYGWEKPTK